MSLAAVMIAFAMSASAEDGMVIWGASRTVTDPIFYSNHALAVQNGDAYVAWSAFGLLSFRRMSKSGASDGRQIRIDDSGFASVPSIVVAGETVCIAWNEPLVPQANDRLRHEL